MHEEPAKDEANEKSELDEAALDQLSGGMTELTQQVNISGTPPNITDVKYDENGNVIGYTERMTRLMQAGPWQPK